MAQQVKEAAMFAVPEVCDLTRTVKSQLFKIVFFTDCQICPADDNGLLPSKTTKSGSRRIGLFG